MADTKTTDNLIHYEGQYGVFDYDPAETEPIIDEDKALAFDEECGATMEIWDYDPLDTLAAAAEDPSHYDFLIKGWDFGGIIPEGFHDIVKDIDVELEF